MSSADGRRPPAVETRSGDLARKLKTHGPCGSFCGSPRPERRACRILGLHRNTARYQARPRRAAPEVERALLAVFSRHPRLGHRKAKVLVNRLLAAQGLPAVGLRRIRRLRRVLCLSVPQEKPRRLRRGHTTGRIPTKAAYARHVCTWDFVSDITTRGGGFRTLVLIDEHTKQSSPIMSPAASAPMTSWSCSPRPSRPTDRLSTSAPTTAPSLSPALSAMVWPTEASARSTSTRGRPGRTATSNPLTPASATSASMASSFTRCRKLASSSPTGSASTTRNDPTGAWAT